MSNQPDDIMQRVGTAMDRAGQGDRAGARALLTDLWRETGDAGDPFHRCAIAHTLADLQDDVAAELQWDQRALVAAGELTDERLHRAGVAGTARGFAPSLHLNLADAHRRLGAPAPALVHVGAGLADLDAIEDDAYREMIRSALHRVREQLDAPPPR